MPPARPEHRPLFKVGVAAVFLLSLGALAAIGYFGYRKVQAAREAAIREASAPAPALPPPPPAAKTESPLVRDAVSGPGTLVEKTQASLEQSRQARQDPLNELGAAAAGAPPASPEPAPPTPLPAPKSDELAPISERSRDITATRDASEAFLSFAMEAQIRGVFQGTPPRALINGKTYRVGQLVDISLGITFSGVDVEQRRIFFRDASGATVTKRY